MITIRLPVKSGGTSPSAFMCEIGEKVEIVDSNPKVKPVSLIVVGVHPDSITCEVDK